MNNFINYIQKSFRTMEEVPMNDVDALVFTQLVYLKLIGIVPQSHKAITLKECARRYKEIVGRSPLLESCAASPRFQNIQVSDYDHVFNPNDPAQFVFLVFHLEDGSLFVTYQGTDDTITGWIDAFRMSYEIPPSLHRSAMRLQNAVRAWPDVPIYVGGHSKGGALALYAAMELDEDQQKRIKRIWNFDGPGLSNEAYDRIRMSKINPWIVHIRPQYSVIGFLFDREEPYEIIHSNAKGFLQHDPHSWEIQGSHFVKDVQDPDSIALNEIFKKWINSTDLTQRRTFVRDFFDSIRNTGSNTLSSFLENTKTKMPTFVSSLHHSDPLTRKAIRQLLFSTVTALPQQWSSKSNH